MNRSLKEEKAMTMARRAYAEVLNDEAERNRLLMEQLPQVRCIARRIHDRLPQHVSMEDLIHAGVLGLIDALHKYDPQQQVQFKSYASFRIRGAILDSLRDLDWSPRDLRRKARRLAEANTRLGSELGRAASEQELADEFGMRLDEFQHMLTEIGGLEINSLQAECPRDDSGADLSESIPGDPEQSPYAQCLKAEMKQALTEAIAELSEKEQQVLALYYFEELTMKEVGAVLGIGESRVSQIHSLALVRLRSRIEQERKVIPAPVLNRASESATELACKKY
jgi:RNA polymerase sigma factor for flagellar operon FliA